MIGRYRVVRYHIRGRRAIAAGGPPLIDDPGAF